MKTLLTVLKKYRLIACGILVAAVVESLLDTLPAQVLGTAVDVLMNLSSWDVTLLHDRPILKPLWSIVTTSAPIKIIILLSTLYFIVALANILVGNLRGYLTTVLGEKSTRDLRINLFDKILNNNIYASQKYKTGDFVARATDDLNSVRQIVISPINGLLIDLFALLWVLYFSFKISYLLAIIMIIPAPLMIYFGFYFGSKQEFIARSTRAQAAEINSNIINRIKGLLLVKIFNREREESNNFKQLSGNLYDLNIKSLKLTSWFWPITTIIKGVAVSSVLIVGGYQVLNKNITAGELLIIIQYLNSVYLPLINISRFYNSIASAKVGMDRVSQILEDDSSIEDVQSNKIGDNTHFEGLIKFEDLSFRYNDTVEILNGISFTVKPNEKVAILGPSGTGKSTLLYLLLRLYKRGQGMITIDGVNVDDIPLSVLRKRCGLLAQEPVILDTTLRENIAYADPGLSDEAVTAVLKKVRLSYIRERHDLDARLIDHGQFLSGGEKQKISMARLFVTNPDIVLLDEPTTYLDANSKNDVLSLINDLFAKKTVLIASHDPSVLDIVDRVIMLNSKSAKEISVSAAKRAIATNFS